MRVSFVSLLVVAMTASGLAVDGAKQVKRILHFSDVHLNISSKFDSLESAAMPFSYGKDAPIALLESALEYAQQVLPDPDFLLYTGDHAAHGDFTDEYIAHAVDANVKTFEKYYPLKNVKNLEATAIIGNADGNPDYHMEVTDPEAEVNPSIALISQVWKHTLSKSNFDTLNRRGYLKYPLDDNLVLLTLNTVPYSPSHVPDTSKQPDPFGQFEWLNRTLSELRAASKYVYIAGHIAPMVDSYGGAPQWHVHYIQKYKEIVACYADVVKAQFFGHVHSVEFRIPVANTNKPTNGFEQVPLFVSGSISPLFGNNPSFMVWEYDAETYDVLDYHVYGTNISDTKPQLAWQRLFQASHAYNVSSLSTAALRDLYERMQVDTALVEDYYWNMKAQSHRLPPCSSPECRAKILCTMKWWTSNGEYQACVDSSTVTYKIATQSAPVVNHLPASQVYQAIGITVFASAAAIACVAAAMYLLKRSGAIKTAAEREKEYENVFPML